MPNKEEKPAMMHPINLDLSQQLSPGSSQAGSQQQRDPIATSRSAKTRTESSSSTIASRTRRRLSALLPRSDTSHAHAASPHPTHPQADTNSSTQAAQGSQAIISHAHPPAEAAPVSRSAPAVASADVGDARDHGLSLSLSQGGSASGPFGAGAGAGAGADVDADPMRSPSATSPKNMLLSDLYKSTKAPLARFRHHSGVQHGPLEPDYSNADLVSRDKIKQKEAVKRYLADRIRNDWEFKWPPETTEEAHGQAEQDREAINDSAIVDSSEDDDEDEDDDSLSDYSTVSEDPDHFRPRAEWLSDLSDMENEQARKARTSAYRFSSPDSVGAALQASELERSAKRRKAVRDEIEWNTGLACFSARRDAWTGAKTVRVRSAKPPTPPPQSATPTASKRLSWFRLSSSAPTTPLSDPSTGGSPISPTTTRASADTTIAVSHSSTSDGDSKSKSKRRSGSGRSVRIETLLPTPPPILPPANPMRASITPATYSSIYDRIVVSSMTPACPINLQDVIRSCVVGWKRDGEWPPRAAAAEVAPVVAVKKKKKRQAGNGSGGGSGANTSALRKNSSARKDSNASRDSSANNKPSAARRLSLGFLGKKDTNTTIGTLEAGLGGGNGKDNGNGSRRSHGEESRGLRKSLQRVLGLGHDKVGGSPVALN